MPRLVTLPPDATLGLARPGISIDDPACVAKSWPGFWASLALFEGV